MKHSFYCKKIGQLSSDLLKKLGDFCSTAVYSWNIGDDFCDNLIDFASLSDDLSSRYLEEMSKFFNKSGHIKTNIARMHPCSYLREHSDLNTVKGDKSRFFDVIKLQIPIITNDHVMMMWTKTLNQFHVERLKVGEIYIFDNIVRHSVVNGGDSHRFNLTSRFNRNSIVADCLIS